MAQHISVRVPWKDNGYCGCVCRRPQSNVFCTALRSIAENKNVDAECRMAGQRAGGRGHEIACLIEGGFFMSSEPCTVFKEHPYKERKIQGYEHFLPTPLTYPPFSLPARPFAWLMRTVSTDTGVDRSHIEHLCEARGIDFHSEKEPCLDFDTNWVQSSTNVRSIFRSFYEDVVPGRSLVIIYAKRVPFVEEDTRRVVIGIGRVAGVTEPPEYRYNTDDPPLRSVMWDTMIAHSIRNSMADGFLLPYSEMAKYARKLHGDFDMSSVTVFADDDKRAEFSYATELVSYDAVISILKQAIKSLAIINECIPDKGNWRGCIKWCKERLAEVWQDRGIFPGVETMLMAMGVSTAHRIVHEARQRLDVRSVTDSAIPSSTAKQGSWPDLIYAALSHPEEYFSEAACTKIKADDVYIGAFLSLEGDRKVLFWLLARMQLPLETARVIFNPERRQRAKAAICDSEIVANPYVLYERLRLNKNIAVPLPQIDAAMFPDPSLAAADPLEEPTRMTGENDARRIRAYMVYVLEKKTERGHTLYPELNLINEINDIPLERQLHLTSDVVSCLREFLSFEVVTVPCVDGTQAMQLTRLRQMDDVIRAAVLHRLGGTRHKVDVDWRKVIDDYFDAHDGDARDCDAHDGEAHDVSVHDGGSLPKGETEGRTSDVEQSARQEKAAVLQELSSSRLSVLIGGAGSGKTTVLSLLCAQRQIADGGVLLLAPTGKARIRLAQAAHATNADGNAQTVAQFLMHNGRFDRGTLTYQLSHSTVRGVPRTVIVDECSMLTEEMFAALMQSLKNAQRIILCGDPNQLPPLGAGRPFVDLVAQMGRAVAGFPRVGAGFGELTVTRRQRTRGPERMDTALARWYGGTLPDNQDDDIFDKLQRGLSDGHVKFYQWNTPEELQTLLLENIAHLAGMTDVDDIVGFNLSLGGTITATDRGKFMNFDEHPEKIEDWQVLSASKNDDAAGTAVLNRIIQGKYHSKRKRNIGGCFVRYTAHLLGADALMFGDKVINTVNHNRGGSSIANGEIGIVSFVDDVSTQVIFSSQPWRSYSWPHTYGDDDECEVEAAYALTVHKSQGSEFGNVILVLDKDSAPLSRELLYTAMTRQKDCIVILFNDKAATLRGMANPGNSVVAARFTSLFDTPDIVRCKDKLYENRLIHKTLGGEMVRSKSEVIIADALYDEGICYEYEQALDLGVDGVYYPDFTVDDAESGKRFYWEHCGLLGEEEYRSRWEHKKAVYAKHGIIEGQNLIVTQDDMTGGIDSAKIRETIRAWMR